MYNLYFRSRMNKKISPFITKLNSILENTDNHNCMCWDSKDVFKVTDSDELSKNVLTKYFKHHNFSSFIRQLNLYGFQKVKTQHNNHYYRHINFIRNSKKSMKLIQRKQRRNQPNNNLNDIEASTSQVVRNGSRMEQLISQLKKQNDEIKKQNDFLNQKIKISIQENKKQIQRLINFLTVFIKNLKMQKVEDHPSNQSQKLKVYNQAILLLQKQMFNLQGVEKDEQQKKLYQVLNDFYNFDHKPLQNSYNQTSEEQMSRSLLEYIESQNEEIINQVKRSNDKNQIFQQKELNQIENEQFSSCLNIDNFF